jgi:demethylmenaquinone methyltransferase / 2-methoxy-6-polyprenyl-1,4-benzoquinol methylase
MQAPHPPLKKYYRAEQDRSGWVRSIFSRTAGDYERVVSAMALGTGSWYRRHALKASGLRPGMTVVDVGTGTGQVAREAAAITGDARLVIGVDPSPGMVEHAHVPTGVTLMIGSAESLPLANGTADFLCMGYALRHISDLSMAYDEFYRVLRPGGTLCVLEITKPENVLSRALLKVYMRGAVPLMARLVARHVDMPELMRYYWDTIEACISPSAVMGGMRFAGFTEVNRHVELGVFSEYRARKPLH